MSQKSNDHIAALTRARASALADAVFFLLLYMGYSLMLRIFSFTALSDYERDALTPFGPPFSLAFLLGGELLIGIFIGVLLYFSSNRPRLRAVTAAFTSVYLLMLAADQMAFKFFFQHLDVSLYAESHDLARMWSSVADGIDIFFGIDLAVAAVLIFVLWRRPRPGFILEWSSALARKPAFFGGIALFYMVLTPVFVAAADQNDLENTLLCDVVKSFFAANEAELPTQNDGSEDTRTIADTSAVSPDDLTAVSETVRENTRRLNVVFYVIESSPLRETSLVDNPRFDTTPFLKELAGDSLLFKNYYSVFPGSTRGVFTSLSGIYPNLDISSDIARYSEIDVPTLPDTLREAGYETAFFASSDTQFDSFDTFLTRRAFDHYMDVNLLSEEEKRAHPTSFWGVDEEVMVDAALKWIEQTSKQGKPFFVTYTAVFPHHPYKVPARAEALTAGRFGKDDLKSRYRASLLYADSAVRRFFEGLKTLGVEEDTLFVVTPDHGEAFGDLHDKNRLHADKIYEENVHTFLILHNRRALGAPRTAVRLACQADLFPTVLDVLGIKRDLPLDGKSLMVPKTNERALFFFSRQQEGVRAGEWKAIWRRRSDATELYNLSSDPDEQRDISAQFADKAASLRALHGRWKTEVNAHYAALLSATGLTDDEVEALNKKKREQVFGAKESPTSGIVLCAAAQRNAPFFACSEPTISSNGSLVARVQWRGGGAFEVRALVFSPAGTLLGSRMRFFNDAKGETGVDISGIPFDQAGRYKVRVLILNFNVIVDVKTRYFNVS